MLRPRDLTVRDVMSTQVLHFPAATSVAEASSQLLTQQVSGAPVMDGEGLLGSISTSDLLDALIKGIPVTTALRDLAQPPVTCAPDLDLTEACRRMVRDRVRCLLVVEDGEQVGVFSAIDTVRALACLGDRCLTSSSTETVQRVEK